MSNLNAIEPLVSIVICTFNGEPYLRQQLDSILSQSYSNLEIVIVDDASSDNSKAILEEYSRKDQRIKYYSNTVNLGYNKNFEKGFSLATASYIAISDQDDIWESNKIELMMKNWPDDSLFIYSLSGSFIENDFENRKQAPATKYKNISQFHQLVFNSPIHGHACMFKKELLHCCLPIPSDIFYDWWMSMHAVKVSSITYIPFTLTWHRIHEKNSSRTILSIKDKLEKNTQLRKQFVFNIESFFTDSVSGNEDEKFLLHFTGLLKKMNGTTFSKEMFYCIMKNRWKIFHYKKNKPFLFISHLKHALRIAKTGVL